MKLLLDIQGAQCQSRHRGIGRYTLALTRTLLAKAVPGHDVRLLFNTRFEDAADSLIGVLGQYAHPDQRIMLNVPEGVCAQSGNAWLRQAAMRMMRHTIERQDVDIVWHSSVVEGYSEDALLPDISPTGVSSVATLYDLIPMHAPDAYLNHPRAKRWYEQSLQILRRTDRLLAISEWVRKDAIERLGLSPDRVITIGAAVDGHFKPQAFDPEASRSLRQRLRITRPFVLYSGGLDPRKNVAALILAFGALPETLRSTHQLVIVGRHGPEEMARLSAAMRKARLPADSVIFTGYANDDDLARLYTECALFVFPSLLEGFGLTPLEAMACGAPVIASDAASLPEVIGRQDALFDPRRVESITEHIALVIQQPDFAKELRQHGLEQSKRFNWPTVADRALDAIQSLAAQKQRRLAATSHPPHRTQASDSAPVKCHDDLKPRPDNREAGLLDELAAMRGKYTDDDLAAIAAMVVTARPRNTVRRWLVDVSSIADNDIHTGIQRVVRSTLRSWLKKAPNGVHIEPVRFTNGRYRFARRYTSSLLGIPDTSLPEDAVDAANGDHFIGLDWAIDNIVSAEPQLRDWHRQGVSLHFVINDLLPITLPGMFHPFARGRFDTWLRCVASMADQLICISQATADDLRQWLDTAALDYQFGRRPSLARFSLGVDALLANAIAEPREPLRQAMQGRPTLLMVGTIEPRKGHEQALDACELLWHANVDVNLVMIGHTGWMMEAFHTRLDHHPEREKRLFWIDDATDAELDAIYRLSTALLAASWGEGYGLPLVEAARRGLPVITRDLPVFHEVMGEHAYYYTAPAATDLAKVLRHWLSTPHAAPDPHQWPSWEQSAVQLSGIIASLQESQRHHTSAHGTRTSG